MANKLPNPCKKGVAELRVLDCGCAIMQMGLRSRTGDYDIRWCPLHEHTGILCSEAMVAIMYLHSLGDGKSLDVAGGLIAALKLMGWDDRKNSKDPGTDSR